MDPRAASPSALRGFGLHAEDNVAVSKCARFSAWEKASASDIVAVRGAPWFAGKVLEFLSIDGDAKCRLSRFVCIERTNDHSRWSVCDAPTCVVPLTALTHVFIFRDEGDCVLLLHPYGM